MYVGSTGPDTPTARPRMPYAVSLALFFLLAFAPAAFAQPTLSKVFTPSTIGPGSVSTITFTITNGSVSPVTSLAFTDVLPAAVTIADPANASTTCDLGTSGTLSAPDGGSTITLSDAQVGSGSCTVTVDVTSGTPGMHTNPAITLSSSAGSSMSSAVDLTVDAGRPGFLKSFAPSSVPLGGRSTLTLTFDNSANALAVTFLSFTDNLPDGLEIADPANTSTTCGQINFTLAAAPGTTVISLLAIGAAASGFEVVTAGGTCTITVDVVAISSGALDNVTGDLTTRVGANTTNLSAGKASATLDVTVTPVAIAKTFTDDPVPPGGTATLEFLVYNFSRDFSATNLAFSDDFGAALTDLTFDTLVSNTCLGLVDGLGTTALSLTGGSIGPEGFCTVEVKLAVPSGAAPGAYPNTTSAVGALVDGSPVVGNMASDTLFVSPAPLLTKVFQDNPVNPGDSVTLEFTVTSTSLTSSATNIAFTDFFPEIFPTASVTPANGCCGAGSTCTFYPLIQAAPPSGVTPARLIITGGTLAPSGMTGDSCTFSITLDMEPYTAPGVYTNTTTEITATVDGATRTGDPASDDLTVISAPRLSKAFADDPVEPGGTVTLEFTLTHSAGAIAAATGITFTDDLTTVLTGLTANVPPTPDPPCGAGSSLVASAGDTLLTLMDGSLLPGEDCTFSVTLDVPAGAAPGDYTNTTSGVSADVGGFAATAPPALDDLKVAGLAFSKEFIGDPVVPGDQVTLRFTLENISPTDDASSISFSDKLTDILPGSPDLTLGGALPMEPCGAGSTLTGTSTLFFDGGSLLQGAPPCSFDVVLNVPAGIADGTYFNATSPLSAVIGGSSTTLSPATDALVVDSALLTLTKEFLDDPVEPGADATLRFTLENLDGANQASAIAFTDNLEATLSGLVAVGLPFAACGGMVEPSPGPSTIGLTGGVLAPGANCSFDVTVTVPGAAAAGTYPNTTTEVTGLINGLAVHGDPGTDDLAVLNLLDFSKSFDGPTVVGGTAVLTFTITNPGAVAAGSIGFSDDLNAVISGLVATNLPLSDVCGSGSQLTGSSFLTLSGGSLPPSGGTCSFDVDVLVPVTATDGDFLNTTGDLFDSGLVVAPPATATLTIEPPPEFNKSFTPNAVGLGFTSVLTLTINNTASSLAASDLDFTDNLPAGLLVASPPNASTTCTGGTLTAMAGSNSISYTAGGSVGAGATCMVQVDVVTGATGFLSNTTGNLTSSSGNSGKASAVLAVDPQPGFWKSFSPHKIAIGGVSTLTFTIDNSFATVEATGLDFTDNLPAEIVIATPSNATTDCTGGTLTAADGGSVITYTGGTVAAMSSCTVDVDVTSSTVGTHENTSGALTSSLGNSGTASANLRVNPPPEFSKAFAPDPTIIGGVVTLTFTIDNTESTASATDLDFTDNLPAALLVADPANVMNTGCGGTVTAVPGTAVIHLTGGSVSPSSICTLSVDVVTSAAGDIVNTTGELTSSLGSSGTAEGTLRVNPPPVFSKAFVPSTIQVGDTGTLVFSINNTGSTADATDLDFSDTMPAEVTIADPANATTDCDGGIITAVAGTGVVAYTGGIAMAGVNCTVSVDITSSTLGMHVNTSGELTSSLGNSGTAEATLTVVDLDPPTVTSVTTSAGPLAECDTVRSLISNFGVTITDTRTPVLGADSTAAYFLVEAGADGDFTTADCTGTAGDDVAVTVSSVLVNDTDPLAVVATVEVAGSAGLAPGKYRFFVCDTITDTAGNALDGDGDMTAGGDFVVPFFRADPGNRLVNGHFDDCPATLDPWVLVAVPPNDIQTGLPGTDDNLGSPLSASARFLQSVADPTSFGQCVGIEDDVLYDFESWVRYDAPTDAVALFVQTCEYFDGMGCTGTSLGESSVAAVLEDSGGAWTFSESIVRTAPGAVSALCTYETGPLGGNSLFDLYLDGLFFGAGDLGLIFADGFESGDTSAWSSTVP